MTFHLIFYQPKKCKLITVNLMLVYHYYKHCKHNDKVDEREVFNLSQTRIVFIVLIGCPINLLLFLCFKSTRLLTLSYRDLTICSNSNRYMTPIPFLLYISHFAPFCIIFEYFQVHHETLFSQ